MILALDDISSAWYKKLKVDSDKLNTVGNSIKLKEKLIVTYNTMWQHFVDRGEFEAADSMWLKKHQLEVELSALRRDEELLLRKVRKYVSA